MNLPPETRITIARSLSDPHAENIPAAELGEVSGGVTARYVETALLEYPPVSQIFDERGGLLIAFNLPQDGDLREIGEAVADLGAAIAGRERIWPGSSAEVRLVAAIDGRFMYALTPAEQSAVSRPGVNRLRTPECRDHQRTGGAPLAHQAVTLTCCPNRRRHMGRSVQIAVPKGFPVPGRAYPGHRVTRLRHPAVMPEALFPGVLACQHRVPGAEIHLPASSGSTHFPSGHDAHFRTVLGQPSP